MKVYKRNPFFKVISILFILVHSIVGGRMVSTNNTIMGSIVIAVSLFWIFALINEFTPYIKMDENSMHVYGNFISQPRVFIFNKEFQIYYHTRERLVFTYLDSRGIREKARVQLGYMNPEDSALFVQDFRNIIARFHPDVKNEAVTAETAVLAEVAATTDIEESNDMTKTKVETQAKSVVSKKAKTSAVAKTASTKTAKVNTTKKAVKKKKDSEKE